MAEPTSEFDGKVMVVGDGIIRALRHIKAARLRPGVSRVQQVRPHRQCSASRRWGTLLSSMGYESLVSAPCSGIKTARMPTQPGC
jgi:hypothetical protein